MTNTSFFHVPDTARDPKAPPRYFVATPDDEAGNYSISAVFDNKADAVEYIDEFKDEMCLFLLVEVLDTSARST